MEFAINWPVALAMFGFGISLQLILRLFLNFNARSQAQKQADEIVEQAQDLLDESMDYAKEAAQDFEQELIDKNTKTFDKLDVSIKRLEEKVQHKESELNSLKQEQQSRFDKRRAKTDNFAKAVSKKEEAYQEKKKKLQSLKTDYAIKLASQAELNKEDIITEQSEKLIQQTKTKMAQWLEDSETEAQTQSERNAKKTINIALNRFARPYCPERGIGFLIMKNEKDAQRMMGPDNKNMILLEEICGIDIIYNERANSLSVSGFDPVRRELARATLEKLYKQRNVNEKVIRDTVEKCKIELFKSIKKDGEKISRELKLKNLSSEIKNMMGALRYRYSFTQNQFFHCAEVGHICGLLAAEVNDNVDDAKRAGVLHDIGKAMDHSIDGGHAVIGADFISKHGEDERIVHPVRAHHFDETPSSDLAYLVIGADAVSGARPGARRSTAVSYHQKMDQLQEIGNSFDGVIDTFILSAGREVRITVDSASIDDHKALKLSEDIANKIEAECSYPGTIKVTVVRRTQATELAR